jgi:hypothetical protein
MSGVNWSEKKKLFLKRDDNRNGQLENFCASSTVCNLFLSFAPPFFSTYHHGRSRKNTLIMRKAEFKNVQCSDGNFASEIHYKYITMSAKQCR